MNHPLWTSLRIGLHILQSRLVLPPMASGTADETGLATEKTLRHYERIVSCRHGLAFVEYTTVHPLGRSEANQAGLYTDRHAQALAPIAAMMKERGVLPGIQLTHAGGKTDEDLIGRHPLGASVLPIPAHGEELPTPDPMTDDEIEDVYQSFVLAALRAEDAGFAVIEIHGAHGYFFNQWLSPLTNQRSDRHGGSLTARSSLLIELVKELRDRLRPETLLSLRYPGQDRLPGGLALEDGLELAEGLKHAGVDLLNVSSGLGGWRRGRDQRGEGYLVDDAIAIRSAVGIPVIGVGGISSLEYCERILNHTEVDLLAVGRAILKNPDWPMATQEVPCNLV